MVNSVKIWTIKRLSKNIRKRQLNKFDCNIAVSGGTGSGKSTFVAKLLFRSDNFKPWSHICYKRGDVISLIQNNKFGICWDDEAINTSYKRQFQNTQQHELIKTVAMYRSNFNLYIATLPEFFSLDKDLRDYYAIHIFIIERGLAIMLRRDASSIFTGDRWYSKYNQKLEESWQKRKEKSPKFRIPYHKLKGFVAYIKFNDLTKKQRNLIEEIKEKKRAEASEKKGEKNEKSFSQKLYEQLVNGKLTREGLQQVCLFIGKKYSIVIATLNKMLKDNGEIQTVKNFLVSSEKSSEPIFEKSELAKRRNLILGK